MNAHYDKGPAGPFFMAGTGPPMADKKKPAEGGWKDCNTNQEEVLLNRHRPCGNSSILLMFFIII